MTVRAPKLHGSYGDRVQFHEVIVRQAHPGEDRHGFETYAPRRSPTRGDPKEC
ncbi:MAG: hypothetical protein H0T13_04595 [Actinobacteria bacterium]|nr:hypothetical protein [Actinomycetota bacterium]